MSYIIEAKNTVGNTLVEEFKYMHSVLKAAKTALKLGLAVTITKQVKKGKP